MKRIYTLIVFSFLVLISFGQKAESFTLIDSVKGQAYEVKKGSEVTVKTDSLTYVGAITDVTENKIVVENLDIPWTNIESIKFYDKEVLKNYLKISSIALLATTIVTAISFINDTDGFAGLIIFLFTLPALFVILLVGLFTYLKYKKGRTIKYKDK